MIDVITEGTQAPPSLTDVFTDVMTELSTDAPPASVEFVTEDGSSGRKKPRRRKGENEKPTPLQQQYLRQCRTHRASDYRLLEEMSTLVAWTWLPGRDRTSCPPIVDLRSPRLLTMDRFPDNANGRSTRVGLTMHRCNIGRNGRIGYASPDSVEMFKDFSLMPKFKAGGLALDSRNETVFKAALELDYHLELVAKGKLAPTDSFDPPQVLVGFPTHYLPSPEWKTPMQEAVRAALRPDASTLNCLLSPGGLVLDIVDTNDGFKTVKLESQGNQISIRMPTWAKLSPKVQRSSVIPAGEPVADLPRFEFNNMRELTGRYSFSSLEWLERRILDEKIEMVSIEEEVVDRQTGQRHMQPMTWRCLPSQFVQSQMGRAVRYFLDFRRHLGRRTHKQDSFGSDEWSENGSQVRIDVMKFPSRPSIKDLQFADGPDEKEATWSADLMSQRQNTPWANRLGLRGIAVSHPNTMT